MKKQKQLVIVGIMLVMLATVSLSGCVNEKSKFVGTWTSEGDLTMIFADDNTVTISGVLGDLSGTYTWAVAGDKITFTANGSAGYTLDYRFPTDNQLILTNSNGASFTLTKA
jgi:hypothetical protein